MTKYFCISGLALVVMIFVYTTSCVHKGPVINTSSDGNYPPEIATIIINKCAITGCHNQASYKNANNLLLDTWDHLFDGGANGAEVIAYSPQYSPLLYITNTDPNAGITITPSMPFSTPGRPFSPLSKTEYNTLYNWINNGAPDKNGNIPFASNPDTRQKIYLTCSGCDELAVIDGQRKVVMRYVPMGLDPTAIENAHEVEISKDGKCVYVVFYSGNYIQKFDARADQAVGSVDISSVLPLGSGGAWSVISLADADTALVATNAATTGNGGIQMVNTSQMALEKSYLPLISPHGITNNETFDTFFVASQYGNTVYRCTFSPVRVKTFSLNGLPASQIKGDHTPDPHQLEMAPDGSKFFATCQGTNEVRVMDAHTGKLLDSIQVGSLPQEMTVSESLNYLFVTCQEDSNANVPVGRRGSIYVIDIADHHVVKVLYGDFYQPHDLAVDEQDGYLYIASTNANPNGPAPHHATSCNGRPGWYTVYYLNSLQPADNKRYEVLVNPYALNARF